jgi:hypothetical protein
VIDEATKEKLRTQTVELLLVVRAAYLADGGNPLKHWDQIQDRMRSAARRAQTPEEWATLLCKGLQLPVLSGKASKVLVDLVAMVAERGCAMEWLDLIEREYGLLMALTRLCAEQRREDNEQRREDEAWKASGGFAKEMRAREVDRADKVAKKDAGA